MSENPRAGRRRPPRTPRRPRRKLSRGRLVAFAVASILGFFVLLEGALQVAARLQPAQTHIAEDSDVEPPVEEAFRILAVGDSWVFGAESEPEEAFVEVLARRIEADTGKQVQVYNFGESASNSSQALLDVAQWTEPLSPDLIIALTGANNMLHDTGVEEAAALLGEDPRVVPGWSILKHFRTLRLLRQIAAVRSVANDADDATRSEQPKETEIPDLLLGVGGADPTGRTGLPQAPADHVSVVVELEWWPLFVRRDWENGLIWVRASEPRSDRPADRGFMKAWEALFLAQTEEFEAAEATAREALELGGDDSVAWEALAVSADKQDRPLEALKHRIRAADASGFPWIRDRARALALLELEAWEAAESWLLWCEAALPGNLEVLLGLSRLPAATRAPIVEEVLARGPRGRVSQIEFYRWHEVSSGSVERMLASLGEEDEEEPAAMLVARGKAAALTGGVDEAESFFDRALAHGAARPLDRDRALAGLIGLAGDEVEFRALVGAGPAELPVTPSTAPALVAWYAGRAECDDVIRVGQLGLATGISARSFEGPAAGCLSREVGWSLAEQALGRGPVLDRAALVLGQAAGTIPGPIPRPEHPFWAAFEERRFEEVAAFATLDWRGLALAHLGRLEAAEKALSSAATDGGDAAVIAYGRSLILAQQGDFTGSTLAALQASHAATSEPWVQTVAEGIALSRCLKWGDAQRSLLAALRVAPGYLEALEALSDVPQALRVPASEIALRYVPSGRVSADRWANWYRSQERYTEARLALSWPPGVLPGDSESRARRAVALGRIESEEGQPRAAREAFGHAMQLAEELKSKNLFCEAASRRSLIAGEDVDDAELVVLEAVCRSHAMALDAIGRIAALRGECKRVHDYSRKALDAGADPADISGWMEPCSPAEYVDKWLKHRVDAVHHLPEQARELLAHRIQPGDEDELPTVDELAARERPLLVRQLAAMARIAEDGGAKFVALTYPFPGAHHQRLRDSVYAAAPAARIPLLDLYSHFDTTYTDAEWQAMRTPEDHINSMGYAEMGAEILRWLKLRAVLPGQVE